MIDDDFMFRLANLKQTRTGLPVVVWIEVKPSEGDEIPQLLLQLHPDTNPNEWIPITLDSENPHILQSESGHNISSAQFDAIKRWIIKNYQPLMAYWNCEIDTVEVIAKLRKL